MWVIVFDMFFPLHSDASVFSVFLRHMMLTMKIITVMTMTNTPRNTAPRAPRWNIIKTRRRWCLCFNWISRKISRKRWLSEGENWRRSEASSYPPCTSTRSVVRAVYAVRAVRCFVTSQMHIKNTDQFITAVFLGSCDGSGSYHLDRITVK